MPRKSSPETVEQESPVDFPIKPSTSVEELNAIVAAKMCQIILAAPALAKDERNAFAKYNYVSIDRYYETFAKVAAQRGLSWITRETDFEIIEVLASPEGKDREPPRPRSMAKITYAYDVIVAGVGCISDYGRVTILHGITGPQTAGSAASYAEKLFCRVALKAVTGEKDGDAEEPHTVHPAPNAFPGEPATKTAPVKPATPQRPAPPPPPPPPAAAEPEETEEDTGLDAPDMDIASALTKAMLAGKDEIERVEARKYPVFRKRPERPDLIVDIITATVECLNRAELKEFWDLNADFMVAMKEGDRETYGSITKLFNARLSQLPKETQA